MIGLWTLEFDDYGLCLYFTEREMYGGTGNYYWTGTYEVSGETVTGRLKATHYCGAIDPLLNAEEFEVTFQATVRDGEMTGSGSPADFPVEFPFTARKRT